MKFKKLASLLVVGAMVFAMAVPAFASPFGGGGTTDSGSSTSDSTSTEETSTSARSRTVQFTGTTQAPTIDVDVATSMDIILNPYKLSVTPTGGEETTDQLISSTLILTNKSDCDIDITGTFTPTAASGITLVSDSGADASKATLNTQKAGAKNVLLMAAVAEVDGEDSALTVKSTIDLAEPYGNGSVAASAFTAAKTPKAASDLLDGIKSSGKAGVYVLGASGTAVNFGDTKDLGLNPTNDQTPVGQPLKLAASDDGTYVGFKIFGAANHNVTEAWTTADTVSVAMTLSITPQVRTAST